MDMFLILHQIRIIQILSKAQYMNQGSLLILYLKNKATQCTYIKQAFKEHKAWTTLLDQRSIYPHNFSRILCLSEEDTT